MDLVVRGALSNRRARKTAAAGAGAAAARQQCFLGALNGQGDVLLLVAAFLGVRCGAELEELRQARRRLAARGSLAAA